MADSKKLKNAQSVFNTLCAMLDGKKMRYEIHQDDLVVTFTVRGDDIPMPFVVKIDADRELVRVVSPVPVVFDENKRIDGAIATCQVNYCLADGSFDYDFKTGKVLFRMTSSFADSLLSQELFEYMIAVACYTVDEYNDKFLMLSKGQLSVQDFFKKK